MKGGSFYNQPMRRGPKYGTRFKSVTNIDNDDDDTITAMPPPRKPKTFLDYLLELEQKKASVREHALSSIIRILNEGKECGRLENYSATSLYHILGLIKRGSAKEKQLASQVLGLMAMTLSGTDNAQEIYKETVPVLTEVLTTKVVDPWAFTTLLYSLAMVTFFCANDSVETQATMQIIWKFILPESKLDVSAKVPIIISAAISAWSFLITTIDGWELGYHWQGAISLFLNMLESDDDSVCVPVAEALVVIFDSDNIDKFFKAKPALNYSEMKKQIKDIILGRLEKVSKARSVVSLKQTFSIPARPDWDILKYFKDDIFPQTSERINGNKLTLSSWSSMIQFKFMKNFIGEEEFSKHVLENELFHRLFNFTPNYEKNDVSCLYESTMVKIEATIYLPGEQDPELLTSKKKKQERQLRQSIIDKSKTKVLNKRRMFAEERKGKMYQVESEL